MKMPNLGDYLFWRDKLAKVIGIVPKPCVVFELLEDTKCPHCGGSLGKEQIHMIPDSPLFKENAKPVKMIEV